MRYLLLLLPVLAFANGDDDDCRGHSCNDSDTIVELISGDQVSKNTSLALAQSLGDVDLGRAAQCVVTEQYGIIIWQRQNWEYDPWCIAGILDEQGKYVEAAQMRCFHKPTSKLYGDRCVEILTFSAPKETNNPIFEPVIVMVEDNDDEERAQEFEKRLARIEAGNRAAARAAQQRRDYAQQTIQRLENDSEE